MRKIVWYPTLRCNKACPYCYEHEFPVMQETDYSKWVRQFEILTTAIATDAMTGESFVYVTDSDCYVDVSGGEPFLYPNMVKAIKEISHMMRVSMTTNLTFPDKLREVHRQLSTLTVSYHPHSENWTEFLARVKSIQDLFPDVVVNIVAYLDMFDHIAHIIPDLKLYGVKYHIEPYIYPDRPYTDERKKQLSEIVGDDRSLGWQGEVSGERTCHAGIDQQHWLPNGDVFACGTYLMLYMLGKTTSTKDFYLGNLFDGTYSPPTGPIRCSYPCVVGCDKDFHSLPKET